MIIVVLIANLTVRDVKIKKYPTGNAVHDSRNGAKAPRPETFVALRLCVKHAGMIYFSRVPYKRKTNTRCNGKHHAAVRLELVEGQAKQRLRAQSCKCWQ
jgi:hypothetical protein